MRQKQISRALLLLFTFLAACAPAALPQPSPAPATAAPVGDIVNLKGTGATFPVPIYTEWASVYTSVDPQVHIEYTGIGSGGGKKAAIENTTDFAGSDSLLKPEEYQQGKDLQMYPALAGAVVPIYNVENVSGLPALILSREVLADIYLGKIERWNDPRIASLNPERASQLPNRPITVIHRSDGSGTTEIFTKALAAFSPEWKSQLGSSDKLDWPVDKLGRGMGVQLSSGLAAMVLSTPNSIGYVEFSYALSNKLLYARLMNRAGTTVSADTENVQAAMADYANQFNDQLTTDIVDGPGVKSWPIAGYTYLILHTTGMTDCVKARKLLAYVQWSLTNDLASQRATALGYSTLPPDVRKIVLTKLDQLMCQGKLVSNS